MSNTDWYAIHRDNVRALLASPASKSTLQVWKAQYWQGDGPVVCALAILRAPHQPAQVIMRIVARLSVWNNAVSMDEADPAELVAWSGLDQVDPETVQWVAQKPAHGGIEVVRGDMPGLRMDGQNGGRGGNGRL